MRILQVALGNQFDIRDALSLYGDVIYWDWSQEKGNFNAALKMLVDEYKPDLVFMQVQTPNIIYTHTIKELAEKTKIINWTGDVRTPTPEWFINIGRHIHLTLFTNMHDVDYVRAHGVKADYLQIGVPNEIFKPEGEIKENVPEIVFFGNNVGGFPLSQYRMDMVRKLKERYGSKFGYYGINWGKGIFSVNDQHEEAKYYRGAKIAINLSHFNYPRYTSDRMLRAMGAGCMVLSHEYEQMELEFKKGKHLDTWGSFSQLFDKIDFYLTNDVERKKIAAVGAKHIHKNHTWSNRINDLMKMI